MSVSELVFNAEKSGFVFKSERAAPEHDAGRYGEFLRVMARLYAQLAASPRLPMTWAL